MGRGRSGQTTASSSSESDFLGKKGKSMSVFDSYSKANPHFHEGREWRVNCQRCVYAYEMRRRGYDVEALPNDGSDISWWNKVMEGQTDVYVGSSSAKASAVMIAEQMATWGTGARGFIYVAWKSGDAHVFNVEQTRNGTIFVDAQTGKRVDIIAYLSRANNLYTRLYRTDNLNPTELLEKCVKKRGT